jgi:hypothetical protein
VARGGVAVGGVGGGAVVVGGAGIGVGHFFFFFFLLLQCKAKLCYMQAMYMNLDAIYSEYLVEKKVCAVDVYILPVARRRRLTSSHHNNGESPPPHSVPGFAHAESRILDQWPR